MMIPSDFTLDIVIDFHSIISLFLPANKANLAVSSSLISSTQQSAYLIVSIILKQNESYFEGSHSLQCLFS